jgi:hypothetical protein
MNIDWNSMPQPKSGAVDKVRARRAKLTGNQLASYDRACAAWDEHLTAEIASEDEEVDSE